MSDVAEYTPGPAYPVQVEKGGDMWTLILERDLRHAPERVWQAITQPEHLREWAPFEADGTLDRLGATVKLKWVGTGNVSEGKVTEVDFPQVLAFYDIRWELEPMEGGTRLKLWHTIDRRFISWGAAGWHISLDVLDRMLGGNPIGRAAGADVTKKAAWQRLAGEYQKQIAEKP